MNVFVITHTHGWNTGHAVEIVPSSPGREIMDTETLCGLLDFFRTVARCAAASWNLSGAAHVTLLSSEVSITSTCLIPAQPYRFERNLRGCMPYLGLLGDLV